MKRKRIRTYNQGTMKQLCGEIPQAELWVQKERVVDISVPTAVILETRNGNVFCGYFPPGIHDLRPPAAKVTFDLQHVFQLCRRHCDHLLHKETPLHDRARRCVKRMLVSAPELQLLARLDDEQYVSEPGKNVPFVTDEVAARIREVYASVYSAEVGSINVGGGASPRGSGPAAGRD